MREWERERKRGRKWVMIAKRHFTTKKRLHLRCCVFPEWIPCVGIEIDISQRKTGTAASSSHISRMHSCSEKRKILSSEDSDSDVVLLSLEQPQ